MIKRFLRRYRNALLIWASRRYSHNVTDWQGRPSFRRFCILGYTDEWRDGNGKLHPGWQIRSNLWGLYHWVFEKTKQKVWLGRLTMMPNWFPFNIFVHWWNPANLEDEEWHDHPRWSITIPLRGQFTEETPWGTKLLKPGMVVFRSHKYIHRFKMAPEFKGKTWTMFIVGRRVHVQNIYPEIKRVETPK